MKFYIASALDNAENVRKIASYLKFHGWEQTYDWTTHGPILGQGALPIDVVARKELDGVVESDAVYVLLPGKRGTHVELGAALAAGRPVFILSTTQEYLFADGLTCSFYWHPKIRERIIGLNIMDLAFRAYKAGRKIERRILKEAM